LPNEIEYSIHTLKKFIEKDLNPIISFYGGEPTLRINLMKKFMDQIRAENFVIQTNGTHLNEIPEKYLQKLSIILVSIDGTEAITDLNRGKGTHKKVMKNLSDIRDKFPGELIARMTLTEASDVYRDVRWLLYHKDPTFDGIHWQINFMFDDMNKWKDIEGWIKDYNLKINKLVDEWVSTMENSQVQRIYPFMGIMRSLLLEEKTKLRCGSGWIYHTIDTNGNILACPIAGEMPSFWIGNLKEIKNPLELKDAFLIKNEPCISCDLLDICGGRCLFANYVKPWNGDEGFRITCKTIRNLINKLKSVKNRIKKLISDKIITIEDFDFIKYNGAEIIP
jgi:putative peptide-modifying radical SAM enzyme